jgi:hypothetical protein
MASNNADLNLKFENWITDKLKAENNYQDLDVSIFINFILSALTEDDNSDEEKLETIKPILQELNQVFDLKLIKFSFGVFLFYFYRIIHLMKKNYLMK